MGAYEYQEATSYYRLSVTLAGPGTGWVQSAPPRIACPGACQRGFEVGTRVVLTATPGATFHKCRFFSLRASWGRGGPWVGVKSPQRERPGSDDGGYDEIDSPAKATQQAGA